MPLFEDVSKYTIEALKEFDSSLPIETRWAIAQIRNRFPKLAQITNFLCLQPELLRAQNFYTGEFRQQQFGEYEHTDGLRENLCWLATTAVLAGAILKDSPNKIANAIAWITLNYGSEELTSLNNEMSEEEKLPTDQDGRVRGFVNLQVGGLSRFGTTPKALSLLQKILNLEGIAIKLGTHNWHEIQTIQDLSNTIGRLAIGRSVFAMGTDVINQDDPNDYTGHMIGILGLRRNKDNTKSFCIYDINTLGGFSFLSSNQMQELVFGDGLPYGEEFNKKFIIKAANNPLISMRTLK